MHRIAIFASGQGSNANAILDYFKNDRSVSVVLIVSSKENAGVLKVAVNHGIPYMIWQKAAFSDEQKILSSLETLQVDVIVLAGWLLLIPHYLIRAFRGRIINIHPALLPRFGGKGMYGSRVHEAVRQAGERTSGITIHEVNERYDEGRIIRQESVSIEEQDTAADIERKVRSLELRYYPETIKKFIESLD